MADKKHTPHFMALIDIKVAYCDQREESDEDRPVGAAQLEYGLEPPAEVIDVLHMAGIPWPPGDGTDEVQAVTAMAMAMGMAVNRFISSKGGVTRMVDRSVDGDTPIH